MQMNKFLRSFAGRTRCNGTRCSDYRKFAHSGCSKPHYDFINLISMQRALTFLVVSSACTGFAVWYAHNSQIAERQRMHQGVLRDIEEEEREKMLQSQIQSLNVSKLPNELPNQHASSGVADCENGICDLAKTRFRDPVTGAVYVDGAK